MFLRGTCFASIAFGYPQRIFGVNPKPLQLKNVAIFSIIAAFHRQAGKLHGIEENDQTHFDRYAESWLKRQEPYFKATTLAGYKRNLEIAYLQRRARLSTAARMRRSS